MTTTETKIKASDFRIGNYLSLGEQIIKITSIKESSISGYKTVAGANDQDHGIELIAGV
jgi:hypothetical protein